MHAAPLASTEEKKEEINKPLLWRPQRAVVSTLLATAVLLTGIVPSYELENRQTSLDQPSIARVVPSWGLRTAGAATFNDAQRAIAETWVRKLWYRLATFFEQRRVL